MIELLICLKVKTKGMNHPKRYGNHNWVGEMRRGFYASKIWKVDYNRWKHTTYFSPQQQQQQYIIFIYIYN